MKEMKIAIVYGYGINCQDETEYACKAADNIPDAKVIAEQIHINKFLNKSKNLQNYHMLVLPGGFSGGDQLGAGVYFAQRLKRLDKDLQNFVYEDKKPTIGICNGFQIAINSDLLDTKVDLTYNDQGNFYNGWITLDVNKHSPCIFTKGMDNIKLVVRNAEGKLWASNDALNELYGQKIPKSIPGLVSMPIGEHNLSSKSAQKIVMKYVKPDGSPAKGEYPYNPNGSIEDIAAICNADGNVLGMMPHPEAFNDWTNDPQWTRVKEKLKRKGKSYPREGAGIQIFRNGINYALENLI